MFKYSYCRVLSDILRRPWRIPYSNVINLPWRWNHRNYSCLTDLSRWFKILIHKLQELHVSPRISGSWVQCPVKNHVPVWTAGLPKDAHMEGMQTGLGWWGRGQLDKFRMHSYVTVLCQTGKCWCPSRWKMGMLWKSTCQNRRHFHLYSCISQGRSPL